MRGPKHHFAIFPAIVLIAVILFMLPQPADADIFSDAVGFVTGGVADIAGDVAKAVGGAIGEAVLNLVEFVLGLVAKFTSMLVGISGAFLTFVLVDFNQTVGFYDNSMVQAGWTVVRDIANWFFVVFLVVIAFATILDIQPYGIRRLLPRVILTALFINFSLLFVGVFINITQLFMSFFVVQMTGPYDDIGHAIADAGFGYQNLKGPVGMSGLEADLMEVVNLLFAIVFQLIAAFILAFIAIMLIVRIAVLWVHMILSPLAFLANILPATSQYYNQWLKGLINWGIFGAIASFFIWLSTWLIYYLDSVDPAAGFQLTEESGASAFITSAGFMLQFVTIAIFLIMGMNVAKQLAGTGATIAAAGMAMAGGAVLGGVKLGGGIAARRAQREVTERPGLKKAVMGVGTAMSTNTFLRKIPGVAQAGERLSSVAEEGPPLSKSDKARIDKMGSETIVNTDREGLSRAEKIYRFQKLKERKDLGIDGAQNVVERAQKAAADLGLDTQRGVGREVAVAGLDTAAASGLFGKDLALASAAVEGFIHALKTGEPEQITARSYASPLVQSAVKSSIIDGHWAPRDLRALEERGHPDIIQHVSSTIIQPLRDPITGDIASGALPERLRNFLNGPGGKYI